MSKSDERKIVPIACTLEAGDLPARVAAWKAFARDWVLETERGPALARFLLAPSDQALVAAASLAQREKACCAFFDFAIALDSDASWLCVTAPDHAEEALAVFAEMLFAP
jgi:hypothetical protein